MRGHIEKRGRDTWRLVIELGRGGAGNRQREYDTIEGPKRDAERRLRERLQELDVAWTLTPDALTVSGLLERWLAAYARPSVSPATFESYDTICRRYIMPALGHVQLRRLRPDQISGYYARMLAGGRLHVCKRQSPGLSALSVLHHHRALKQALRWAVEQRLITHSPAEVVRPPKVERTEMSVLTDDQTALLLEAAQHSEEGSDWRYLYPAIVLAVTTGLRRGEVSGLKWADVDLDAGTLAVARSAEVTRGSIRLKEPKTPRSRRTIPLPAFAVETLRAHKVQQDEYRMRAGIRAHSEDLVFAGPDGSLLAPWRLTKDFRRLAKGLGLPLTFHGLRHTHSSQLFRQGAPIGVVSARLGHSSPGVTLNVYAHLLPGMQDAAVAKVDDALREAMERRQAATGTDGPGVAVQNGDEMATAGRSAVRALVPRQGSQGA